MTNRPTPKKGPIVIKLNPNKQIGYKIISVGPGGKETVIKENNFVIHKKNLIK
tara:strand:- start:966 stop:1124 length:159 start_codon:yes stop_codon:yes gene_type:complete